MAYITEPELPFPGGLPDVPGGEKKMQLVSHFETIKVSQPPVIEFTTVDGVFIKQMFLRNAGTFVPQHAHVWDHASLLARGSVFVWKDGNLDRRYEAPCIVHIAAGVKHLFQSLEDDTIIYCIHNLKAKDKVEILGEHSLLDYET